MHKVKLEKTVGLILFKFPAEILGLGEEVSTQIILKNGFECKSRLTSFFHKRILNFFTKMSSILESGFQFAKDNRWSAGNLLRWIPKLIRYSTRNLESPKRIWLPKLTPGVKLLLFSSAVIFQKAFCSHYTLHPFALVAPHMFCSQHGGQTLKIPVSLGHLAPRIWLPMEEKDGSQTLGVNCRGTINNNNAGQATRIRALQGHKSRSRSGKRFPSRKQSKPGSGLHDICLLKIIDLGVNSLAKIDSWFFRHSSHQSQVRSFPPGFIAHFMHAESINRVSGSNISYYSSCSCQFQWSKMGFGLDFFQARKWAE